MALTNDELIKIHDRINTVAAAIKDEELKEAVTGILKDSQIMTAFFSTPASTQMEYGGAYPGGLAKYLLYTVTFMKKIWQSLEGSSPGIARIEQDDLIVAGLFHHFGKIGYPENSMYIPLDSDWHNKRGINYEFNKDYSNVNPALITIWYFNKFGVRLKPSVFEAISNYPTRASENTEFTKNDLATILIAASRLAWNKISEETKK